MTRPLPQQRLRDYEAREHEVGSRAQKHQAAEDNVSSAQGLRNTLTLRYAAAERLRNAGSW